MFSGETLNGQRLIEFRLGHEVESEQGLSVASAELMVRAEAAPRAPRRLRYTLWAFTVHGNASVGELAGATKAGGGFIPQIRERAFRGLWFIQTVRLLKKATYGRLRSCNIERIPQASKH